MISIDHKDELKDAAILLGTLTTYKRCCDDTTEVDNAIDQCIDIFGMVADVDDDTVRRMIKGTNGKNGKAYAS